MNLIATRDRHVGRQGLSTVEVNPVIFLKLYQVLRKAQAQNRSHLIGFNENQLSIRFRDWMQENKGKLQRGDKADMAGMVALAQDFVQKEMKRMGRVPAKNNQTPAQAKAAAFLKQHGADAESLGLLAEDLHDDIGLEAPQAGGEETMLSMGALALDLIAIAQAASPTVAVAAVLLAKQLENTINIRLESSKLLVDKYTHQANNEVSKDTCLLGLEETIEAHSERTTVESDLAALAQNEADPERQMRLLKLTCEENTADIKENPLLVAMKESGSDMTVTRGALFNASPEQISDAKQSPYYIPSLAETFKAGPKFSDPFAREKDVAA